MMHVVFLGGAGGIGASCIAIQTGQHWLLVDAGVRMDQHSDRLPDLAFLQDKILSAIFVTHAHADHIGALPLVQQAFPAVPIYTSRATMLLMEVMLADALQVMAKRATFAQEVPLYGEEEVAATINMLRPLPLTGTVTVPELPGVTIYTARAGHVAGAMSLGFEAADGRVVISGDVSVTPQRTVQGAALIGLQHPDLMVLESTYGSRLHPNRQTEEQRLAQAVADGIERGGHVLIPAFALGRAQEVLRILNEAQRRGSIPEFPVWVDGLVRRVCATYAAIPEALTPALERMIRRDFAPFFTGMIRPVPDPRRREKILQGDPACIITSSGMLTGGPSAFYATHLAGNPDNSILITGYQDEESPGRRLLALAEQGSGTLEIDGQTVEVRCRFDRYNLSAHADGSELAGIVQALKPKTVALVHGDGEARNDLAQRLERVAGVLLPADGQQVEVRRHHRQRKHSRVQHHKRPAAEVIDLTGAGAGGGRPLDAAGLPHLWGAVSDGTPEQIVSVRELALAWYGAGADAAADATVQAVLNTDQRFFTPSPEIPGMVRVKAASEIEEQSGSAARSERGVRPGTLLLLSVYGGPPLPALCVDTRPELVRAYTPVGQRTRFPRSHLLDVIGTWPEYPADPASVASALRGELASLRLAAQNWQRQHPLRDLVAQLEPEQSYTLDEVWAQVGIAADDLTARLAVAMLLNTMPDVFEREESEGSTTPRYHLHTGAAADQAIAASTPRPDQMGILATLEQHIGNPPDLTKRSCNPETGAVSLVFHFPDVARQQYGAAIEAAAAEAGVPITIWPHPHQGMLAEVARELAPPGLRVQKVSVMLDHQSIALRCAGTATAEAAQAAEEQFLARTGWRLELNGATIGTGAADSPAPVETSTAAPPLAPDQPALDMHQAMTLARSQLAGSSCYKVSADQASLTLTLRFHFPAVAQQQYAEQIASLPAQTGWSVQVYPEAHQGELKVLARRVLPSELTMIGEPSLFRGEQQAVVRVRGDVEAERLAGAEAAFREATGWSLVVRFDSR